jgi:hypothetical protein
MVSSQAKYIAFTPPKEKDPDRSISHRRGIGFTWYLPLLPASHLSFQVCKLRIQGFRSFFALGFSLNLSACNTLATMAGADKKVYRASTTAPVNIAVVK